VAPERPGRLTDEMRRPTRPSAFAAAVGVVACALAIASAPLVSAATGGWTIDWTPATVVQGIPTRISLTATNTAGGASVGCVRLQVPIEFSVGTVGIDAVQPAHAWTVDPPSGGAGGSTIVQVHAVSDKDVLKNDGDTLAFHLTVTGSVPGTYVWPANSLDHANCSAGMDSSSVNVAVVAGAPTPTPVPTATPKPTPTPSPKPTPAAAPTPTATPPRTPMPMVSPTASTVAAPSGTPVQTSTPSAAPGSTPVAAPFGEVAVPPLGPPTGSGSTGGGGSGTGAPIDAASATSPFTVAATTDDTGIDASIVATSLGSLDGMVWAVPSLVLTVPGLLLVLAILAQIAAGAAWVPVVRRKLGPFRRRT
jgi:hypothetical protein